ncbi:DUF1214 domain-containing protein [Streptomyces sp. NPDC007070]|uniref:DUF1214 domain-containing protein n=1 Tax=Streptomyces sp. NPDC007070 TaxID=3154312 RepID=UPI003408CB0C
MTARTAKRLQLPSPKQGGPPTPTPTQHGAPGSDTGAALEVVQDDVAPAGRRPSPGPVRARSARCTTDAEGRPLDGAHAYVLHFDAGRTPPVRGFWSLTMMNDRQLFVDNPLDRYAIGDRSGMTTNPDGSLDTHIQYDSPGPGRENNWLPAPEGRFNVFLRLYWPEQSALTGAWAPPPLIRRDADVS